MKVRAIFAAAALLFSATAMAGPLCKVDLVNNKFVVISQSNGSCPAGAPITMAFNNANAFLAAQVCDLRHSVTVFQGDGSRPSVLCSYRGSVQDSQATFSGATVEAR